MPISERQHTFFWTGPFSQWARSEFVLDGVAFGTAEQAMMYRKAQVFGDLEIAAKILETPDPGRQKALGRQVRGFDARIWDAQKTEIVRQINLAKFSQNKGLRRKLFQTGDTVLVEASPMDTIWGIGLDAKRAANMPAAEWPGQNRLGQILTEVRETLKARFPDEAHSVLRTR